MPETETHVIRLPRNRDVYDTLANAVASVTEGEKVIIVSGPEEWADDTAAEITSKT